MAKKAKDTPHLRLRIEPSLLARLEKSADRNDRTLTGEIVRRLEGSFAREKDTAVLNLLVGGNDTYADLFRKIVLELQTNQGWDLNQSQRLQMAERIRAYIYPPEMSEEPEKRSKN
jgi:hypothetical protein